MILTPLWLRMLFDYLMQGLFECHLKSGSLPTRHPIFRWMERRLHLPNPLLTAFESLCCVCRFHITNSLKKGLFGKVDLIAMTNPYSFPNLSVRLDLVSVACSQRTSNSPEQREQLCSCAQAELDAKDKCCISKVGCASQAFHALS